jgi:hypothetical protein
MAPLDPCSQRAIGHIRHLSEAIGERGSCTPAQRQAAEYTAEQMRALGVDDVRLEPYRGAPSTYRPYALAFAAALLGTLGVWFAGTQPMMAVAAVLSALGAWGMLAETDFAAKPSPGSSCRRSIGYNSTSPRRRAVTTACVRSLACSLAMMALT